MSSLPPSESSPDSVSATAPPRREKLRRAAEDGERLYRKRMHDPDGPDLNIADDNRLDGILTLDLSDALGFVDELVAATEGLLDVGERSRSGDPSLDPEEWYAIRDYARRVLTGAY